ncbi:hypothetical protein DRN58_05925 [Thermococci archaeon]|nr:MAG: hypothetical protein DRN58_05925 [Thermococci archaeon]
MGDEYPTNYIFRNDHVLLLWNNEYSVRLFITENSLVCYSFSRKKKILSVSLGDIDIKKTFRHIFLIETSVIKFSLAFFSEEDAEKFEKALKKQKDKLKTIRKMTDKEKIVTDLNDIVNILENFKKSGINTSKLQSKVNFFKSELLKFIGTIQKFEKLKSIASNKYFKDEIDGIKSKIENMENVDEISKAIEKLTTQIEKRKSIKKKIDLIECPFCGREIFSDSVLCPYCGKKLKYSTELEKLLERKKFYNEKLEIIKELKNIIPENEYEEKYEELMDKLVDIEDKIIQEKIKRGKKK